MPHRISPPSSFHTRKGEKPTNHPSGVGSSTLSILLMCMTAQTKTAAAVRDGACVHILQYLGKANCITQAKLGCAGMCPGRERNDLVKVERTE
eukprot:g78671.t1